MEAVDAGNFFHADNALVACLMREPGRSDHVADGVEARHAGTAPFVDHDVAFVDLHPERLQPEPFDITDDADGEDDALRDDLRAAAVRFRQRGGDAVRPFNKPLDPRAGMDDDALPREGLARELGDLGILGGKDAWARSATAICDAVRDEVRNFEAGTEATDDLTVMAIRYIGG